MVIKDNDTDPSTPSARRASEAPPGATHGDSPAADVAGARPGPGTDPGVGDPQSRVAVAPKRPLGIVVPAPGVLSTPPAPAAAFDAPPPAATKKDSVELLLEGMVEQQLDRPKTTPQSDGEASATYHTEHTVHPAERPSPDEGPKVLLDRPMTPTAIQARRSLRSPPPPGSNNRAAAATVVTPSAVGRRVLVAATAGVMVVGAFFFALELALPRVPVVVVPSAAPVKQPPMATATLPPPPVAIESPTTPVSSAPSDTIASAAPPASATGRAHAVSPLVQLPKRRAKPAVPASASTALPSGDLGEFRTSF
jgi:hypothetical protein